MMAFAPLWPYSASDYNVSLEFGALRIILLTYLLFYGSCSSFAFSAMFRCRNPELLSWKNEFQAISGHAGGKHPARSLINTRLSYSVAA